ncbi:MAG: deoxyguanosinetriphosphate triphosphohydrolase [Clostridiales bacterium]|nr:deoxyguanosinetriphosphate triphosphohydrolase [Clostridiales bacterium]
MSDEIRQRTLLIEKNTLSQYAQLCENTKGRERYEDEDPVRTAYQRDRDRIIHSSSFRRLKHKTQVFLSPEGDHYRTRLTHTLEVSQIARTIARALALNEDLIEAVSLGHDLGHTPFGHAGERALDSVYEGGFRHFEQSLRVIDRLEKNGEGLNLTYEVRDGILCHTTGKEADTLEGRLVKTADKIAYINHDIDDAIRARVICNEDIPLEIRKVLGQTKSNRINSLVTSVINNTVSDVGMDSEVKEAFKELTDFMFKNVYTNPVCKGEEKKAESLIIELYNYFCSHPDELPDLYKPIAENEGADRASCDFVASMSDIYVLRVYNKLFIPSGWNESLDF